MLLKYYLFPYSRGPITYKKRLSVHLSSFIAKPFPLFFLEGAHVKNTENNGNRERFCMCILEEKMLRNHVGCVWALKSIKKDLTLALEKKESSTLTHFKNNRNGIYTFKIKNRNTRTRCEIVNFEHISSLVLVFLLITSSR